MGRKLEIDERAWSAAEPATVYALLADGTTWPTWSGIDSFELREPGDSTPEGLGALRAFRTGRTTSIERVVATEPGTRFSYTLVKGLPLADYRADVDLEPAEGGTAIRWHSTFRPGRPGTGWIYRLALGRFIRATVRGLAAHAATLSAKT
ncbi:MAG: SRPBCC family protein [Actinobacteria bacterium]|nr:SRPBCC family protein [Actinomycetota bacterium]